MKNKMKFLIGVFMAILIFGIAGCGGSSPEDVADTYLECFEDADFDTMRQMSTGAMIQWIDKAERKYGQIASLLGEKKMKKFKDAYDDLKLEIGDPVADGEKMTVPVKINGQSTPMTLIRMGDKWRVEKFDFPVI